MVFELIAFQFRQIYYLIGHVLRAINTIVILYKLNFISIT